VIQFMDILQILGNLYGGPITSTGKDKEKKGSDHEGDIPTNSHSIGE